MSVAIHNKLQTVGDIKSRFLFSFSIQTCSITYLAMPFLTLKSTEFIDYTFINFQFLLTHSIFVFLFVFLIEIDLLAFIVWGWRMHMW